MNSMLNGVELLQIVDQTAKLKDLSSSVIFSALESGFMEAYKQKYGQDKDLEVIINRKTGDINAFWCREVVESSENINHIDFISANKINSDTFIGDYIKEILPSLESSSLIIGIIRKVLNKKMILAEKAKEYDIFHSRVGDIVFGVVKSIDHHGNCIMNLSGRGEGIMQSRDLLPNDSLKLSERVRGYIYKVEKKDFGCQIFLSRTHDGMLTKLFELEVPHIYDKEVIIKSIARDPGSRSKVAVYSRNEMIDPISVCIGPKGSRIKNIVEELQGEKIDMVQWDSDMRQFIINAFRGESIADISLHQDVNIAEVIVEQDSLSLIIGRKGQNIRLISKLVGLQIKVFEKEEYKKQQEEKTQSITESLYQDLKVDRDLVSTLVFAGIKSVYDIIEYSPDNLADVCNIKKDEVDNILNSTNKAIDSRKKTYKKYQKKYGVEESILIFLERNGIVHDDLKGLIEYGVKCYEDLVCLSVTELIDNSVNSGLSVVNASKILNKAKYVGSDNDDSISVEQDAKLMTNVSLDNLESEKIKKTSDALEEELTQEQINQRLTDIRDVLLDQKNEYNNVDEVDNAQYQTKTHELNKFKSNNTSTKISNDLEDVEEDNKKKKYREEKRKPNKKDFISLVQRGEDVEETTRIRKTNKTPKNSALQQKSQSKKVYREVQVSGPMTVEAVAHAMSEKISDVLKELMNMGLMITANKTIDIDTIELLCLSFGHTVKKKKTSDTFDKIFEESNTKTANDVSRPPVIAFMGHVDHGKTTIIHALKQLDLVEDGGITQKISAYTILSQDKRSITLLDTPGHSAFSGTRALGSKCVDIIVLVVSAEDGIKPQTIEAIECAKKASLPIIVAINKIDKVSESSVAQVKNALLEHSIIAEDLGGDVIVVPISAKQKINLDKFVDSVLLLGDMMELKANNKCHASGIILDSFIDKDKGVLTKLLVQKGTLKVGDFVVSKQGLGKVKIMYDSFNNQITSAGPSTPVDVMGIGDVIGEDEKFIVVKDEKQAKAILSENVRVNNNTSNVLSFSKRTDSLFAKKNVKQLNIVLKVELYSMISAIKDTLATYTHPDIQLNIVFAGVGNVSTSDIDLASTSGAKIITMNAKATSSIVKKANTAGIDILSYSVVYKLFEDLRDMLNDMLDPIVERNSLGKAKILKVFNIDKVGDILGCSVTSGILRNGAKVDLLQKNKKLGTFTIKELKKEKDSVKEVKSGLECGVFLGQETIDMKEEQEVSYTLECFEEIFKKQKFF